MRRAAVDRRARAGRPARRYRQSGRARAIQTVSRAAWASRHGKTRPVPRPRLRVRSSDSSRRAWSTHRSSPKYTDCYASTTAAGVGLPVHHGLLRRRSADFAARPLVGVSGCHRPARRSAGRGRRHARSVCLPAEDLRRPEAAIRHRRPSHPRREHRAPDHFASGILHHHLHRRRFSS